jgi:hypothetical protein
MTTACATSATEPGPRRSPPARQARAGRVVDRAAGRIGARAAIVALILAAGMPVFPAAGATAPAGPPAAPPAAGRRMSPADLRDQFEKCLKILRKAEDAVDGHDAGRVSLILQRADELIVEFDAGAGIDQFVGALSASRAAAAAGDFQAAGAALRHGREVLRSLADYTVARPTEVAYRSALAALDDRNPHDFEAAVGRLEATVQASYLADRLRDARAAIARGRAAMVRNDMKAGRKEVVAARVALGRMDYAASLGQARHGLLLAAELLRDGAFLTAREQARQGIRAIRAALGRAPEPDVETLDAAQVTASAVWRRLSRPDPGDPGRLEAAADQIEILRQRLR